MYIYTRCPKNQFQFNCEIPGNYVALNSIAFLFIQFCFVIYFELFSAIPIRCVPSWNRTRNIKIKTNENYTMPRSGSGWAERKRERQRRQVRQDWAHLSCAQLSYLSAGVVWTLTEQWRSRSGRSLTSTVSQCCSNTCICQIHVRKICKYLIERLVIAGNICEARKQLATATQHILANIKIER